MSRNGIAAKNSIRYRGYYYDEDANGFLTNGLTEERQYEIIFEFTKMAGDVNAFLSMVFGPSIF